MASPSQAGKRSIFYKRRHGSRTPALQKRPQVKGIVTRVTTMSPKKPNSALRHIAKVKLTNRLRVTARIPGIGYICSKYNRVLVNGGRANDLPGVGYTIIRGVYDFSSVIYKKKTSFCLRNFATWGSYKVCQKSFEAFLVRESIC